MARAHVRQLPPSADHHLAERRAFARHKARWDAVLQIHGRFQKVIIHNISRSGMKLKNAFGLVPGDVVVVELLSHRAFDIQRLREEAARDPLTGLPNRRSLLTALATATAGPSQDGRHHAFFLLDLNEFKRVNDEHGHAIGDRVLCVVVERFKAASRPSDLLARLGGDEFAVLAYDVDRDGAEAIGQRIITSLNIPISTDLTSHQIGFEDRAEARN